MADFPLSDNYVNAIKNSEGFTPTAQWDYKQNSNGYGTKALYPGETIDKATANDRLATELGQASDFVKTQNPNLSEGAHAALTDLTHNAGQKWANDPLGAAIRAGDMDAAVPHFLSYNHAGGEVLPGLTARRAQGATWMQGGPMAQAMQPDPGALYPQDPNDPSQQGYSGSSGILGALFGPASDGGWKGPGGLGNTLQNIGAGLHSISDPSGAAAMMQTANAPRAAALARAQALMLANKPQYQDGGTDPYTGAKLPGYSFSPMTGKLQQLIAQSQPGATPQAGAYDPTAFSTALKGFDEGTVDVEGVKAAAPPGVSKYAQNLVDGVAVPSNLGNRSAAFKLAAINTAHAIDPGFNENQIPARAAFTKDLADSNSVTKVGGAIASSAKIISHADQYVTDVQKLNKLRLMGGDNNIVNSGQAFVKSLGNDTEYKSTVAAVKEEADFLASETAKLASGGKPSEGHQVYLRSMLDEKKDLPSQLSAARTLVEIMHGAVSPLIDNGNTAFNRTGDKAKTVKDYWSKGTNAASDRVMSASSAGTTPAPQAVPTAPQGAPANPVIAAAQAALAKGAPRAAVLKRLQDNGIDPGGL